MLSLKQNKGFLLIGSYLIIIILAAFSAAYFFKSISENNFAQIDKRIVNAKYNAYQGIEYAFIEIQTQSMGGDIWVTHTLPPDYPNSSELEKVSPQPIVSLDIDHCSIDAEGNYIYTNDNGEIEFKVKVYVDPHDGIDETREPLELIILSQGISGSSSRLFVSKFPFTSLYDYFVFTPSYYDMGWRTWEANGGKMHANGNAIFNEGVVVKDVSEFTTAGYFRYDVETYVPEGNCTLDTCCQNPPCNRPWRGENGIYWSLDVPWVNPYYGDNPIAYYTNSFDGHLSGDLVRLQMRDGSGNPTLWDGESVFADYLTEGSFYESGTRVRIIDSPGGTDFPYGAQEIIPNRLSGALYWWNKFYSPTQDYGYPAEWIQVAYTNSGKDEQKAAWDQALSERGLEEVLKDSNDGVEIISPLTINELNYAQAAQEGGIYVLSDSVIINGQTYSPDPETGKIYAEDGTTVIFEPKSFKNTNSGRTNIAAILYVDNMIAEGLNPTNGIIYSKIPIVLENANELPDGGLTTISEENIYLKGNYNCPDNCTSADMADSKPSAAISAKYIYTLSDDFTYPTTLPETIHHLEHPYDYEYSQNSHYDANSDVDDKNTPGTEDDEHWYTLNHNDMPNEVGNDYTYIVSLVGHDGYQPQVLERWLYPKHPNNPGDGQVWDRKRRVIGAFVKLAEDDFPYDGQLDTDDHRGRDSNGWPFDMTSRQPSSGKNIYTYDSRYADPTNPRPPGELYGVSQTVQLEIDNTEENFTTHYEQIY